MRRYANEKAAAYANNAAAELQLPAAATGGTFRAVRDAAPTLARTSSASAPETMRIDVNVPATERPAAEEGVGGEADQGGGGQAGRAHPGGA